jgi:predicted nucleic acid-binding protein
MIFRDIPVGAAVFLDANTLVYHFVAEPQYGTACTELMKRIENHEVQAFVSTHVLSDVGHRLMTLEAATLNGWPLAGLAARLRRHRGDIGRLTTYQTAITDVVKSGIGVLPVTQALIESAAVICGSAELLMGDALLVAVMQGHGLSNLASHDSDFDRVAGITRYSPV